MIEKNIQKLNNMNDQNKIIGENAEFAFMKYLNTLGYHKGKIPFLHIEQEAFTKSEALQDYSIRPDFIIFFNNQPYFIDVKARQKNRDNTTNFYLNTEEIQRLYNLSISCGIQTWIAFIDKKYLPSDSVDKSGGDKFHNFYFVSVKKVKEYFDKLNSKLKNDYCIDLKNYPIYIPDCFTSIAGSQDIEIIKNDPDINIDDELIEYEAIKYKDYTPFKSLS
jgi:hypothetical protein